MTRQTLVRLLFGAALTPLLAGCISVETPDKPIEINLDVNVTQEVIVRMQEDVEQLIQQNPEAFPQRPVTPGTRP